MTETTTTTFKVTITPEARARSIEMLLTNGTPEGVEDARKMLLELCEDYKWLSECPRANNKENDND